MNKLNLQKVAGLAAICEALLYILGFAVMATLISPQEMGRMTAEERLIFRLDHRLILQLYHLCIYTIFGSLLVILVLALHERLKSIQPSRMSVASVFGFIWAGFVIASGMLANIGLDQLARFHAQSPEHALLISNNLRVVQDALGGGVEWVGGIWVLLISWVAMSDRGLPRWLNYLGLAVGFVGVLTAFPGLGKLGSLFGLLQIVWFLWIGACLVRKS